MTEHKDEALEFLRRLLGDTRAADTDTEPPDVTGNEPAAVARNLFNTTEITKGEPQ